MDDHAMDRANDTPGGTDAEGDANESIPGSRAGEEVGLGRVLEDRREATGSPDPGDPVTTDSGLVEEASVESFPASDPPGFMSDTVTPGDQDRDAIQPPSPRDVP